MAFLSESYFGSLAYYDILFIVGIFSDWVPLFIVNLWRHQVMLKKEVTKLFWRKFLKTKQEKAKI